jgi:hypothetical protein
VSVVGFEGVVTEIDLRYVALEAKGHRYLIPNSLLLNDPISVRPRAKAELPEPQERPPLTTLS